MSRGNHSWRLPAGLPRKISDIDQSNSGLGREDEDCSWGSSQIQQYFAWLEPWIVGRNWQLLRELLLQFVRSLNERQRSLMNSPYPGYSGLPEMADLIKEQNEAMRSAEELVADQALAVRRLP